MYLFFWSLGGLFWWFNSCTSWPSLLPLIEQLYSQILAMIFILHGLHKNCEFKMNQFGSRYICYCRTPVSGPSYFGDFKMTAGWRWFLRGWHFWSIDLARLTMCIWIHPPRVSFSCFSLDGVHADCGTLTDVD
nr:uncharacterized protein LOC117274592 isoform X2 [Nicotiana tomentosiformis]